MKISPTAVAALMGSYDRIDIDRAAVLSWFRGKARDNAVAALDLLAESERQGFWIKGASRKVSAALNKQAVAVDFISGKGAYAAYDRFGEETGNPAAGGCIANLKLKDDARCALSTGWQVTHVIEFGKLENAPETLQRVVALLSEHDDSGPLSVSLITAQRWAETFIPVAALMADLDSRRPPRRVAFKTLSKTVVDNLFAGDLKLDYATLREPEIRWEWVEQILPNGTTYKISVGTIIWPEGTRHGSSKFGQSGKAHNEQCEACGHAIKNQFNWVPLVIDDHEGTPHSFWVGKDCAENLFGCEVSGDATYEEMRS